MIDRRGFLAVLGASGLGWPGTLEHFSRQTQEGGAPGDEAFWTFVRGQFLIPEDRIYLNNGTLGPSPRVVVEAVAEHTRSVAATFPPSVPWDALKDALGTLLDGDPEGFVFPRNTTEGMSFVANGLDIGPGDEVLSTDHEHIGGREPWSSVCRRRGAELRTVALPAPAQSSGQLFDTIAAGLTPKTRVLSVSHVTFTTGTVLPVRRLADLCRERGIIFAVDGAHPPGMRRVSLRSLGGDFYASSPHKWLLAPQGTGLLYLTPEWRTWLWPSVASGGWDDLELGAHRFNHLGTVDESRLVGLLAAVEFMNALGMDRVEARVLYLNRRLKEELARIPGITVVSPALPDLSSGMVSFGLDGVESLRLQRFLAREANIRTRVIGEYDYGWMRLSTHIYNTMRDVETVLELVDRVARQGLPGD